MSGAVARWEGRGRRIEVFGHGVFVVEAGPRDAPILAILHGYPSSSADYEQVLPLLSERYRVVVHDHVGFGLSDKPRAWSYSLIDQADVAIGVWRALGLQHVHLLAHDYGTSVATELVARRERGMLPVALSSLTLCNGSVHLELARPRLAQKLLRNRWIGPSFARLASRALFERNLRAICAKPPGDEELARMWQLLVRADGRAVLPAISRYLDERESLWQRWIPPLTRFDRPAHVLWGRRDPVALPAVAEALASEIPGARLTWLDALGHYPMIEAPERWATEVLGFLDGSHAPRVSPAPRAGR